MNFMPLTRKGGAKVRNIIHTQRINPTPQRNIYRILTVFALGAE